MSCAYFPFYSTTKNEIVGIKLNLSGYVTQNEFRNLTGNVNISALKSNAADLKDRVDKIDAGKINIIDELQGKIFLNIATYVLNKSTVILKFLV